MLISNNWKIVVIYKKHIQRSDFQKIYQSIYITNLRAFWDLPL